MNRKHALFLFATLLPSAALADTSISSEIAQDLDDARKEVRTELAQERARLDSENLSLDDGLHFGKESRHAAAKRKTLPNGEITPRGDLLVDGKATAIDAQQRRLLLDYRAQVIDLARTGIDAGEQAAMLAIDATDVSLLSLIVGGLTGSLERRVEATVKESIKPMVLQICRQLPQLRQSQQALAVSVPDFRPYATLEADDVEDCERDVGKELAAI